VLLIEFFYPPLYHTFIFVKNSKKKKKKEKKKKVQSNWIDIFEILVDFDETD